MAGAAADRARLRIERRSDQGSLAGVDAGLAERSYCACAPSSAALTFDP
ncbi:MAG: hypothetical protein JWM53_1126, partial [bacterium]|nr:hypothetical protein [bacterium]